MKRAKRVALRKPRNPVARSPLLTKGGPHGKSGGAERRARNVSLSRLVQDPTSLDEP